MGLRAVLTRRSAAGVARLVLLTLAAAGFLAMHGLAATDAAARHHIPISISVIDEHGGADVVGGDHAPASAVAASPSSPGGSTDHDTMSGCVFVLLSVLAAVILHALGGRVEGAAADRGRAIAAQRRRPRAPPRPVFLSLCVFRL